jgi:hypothetical protein
MDRRDFMKLTALTGLALATPYGVRRAQAQSEEPYNGLFFITVEAGGGWDPTSHVDPKGYTTSGPPQQGDTQEMNKLYAAVDAQNKANWAGGLIPYAPFFGRANNGAVQVGYDDDNLQQTQIATDRQTTARPSNNQSYFDFFDKHASRLLVINGIDMGTNDHMGGQRRTWSGKLADGHPALSALFASAVAREKPMAFISTGGFSTTQGSVAVTRAGNIDLLTNLARPTYQTGRDDNSDVYVSTETDARMTRFQRERMSRAIDDQRLPRWRQALDTLYTVREGNNELRRVMEVLNGNLPNTTTRLRDTIPMLSSAQAQVRIGLGAYRAGIAASLGLSVGGFDTHQNHDQNQIPALRRLFDLVDFIYEEVVNVQGIDWNKVVIMIGSDFGRTPGYNASNGKDHHATTSNIFMGGSIRGGRVLGMSDSRHGPMRFDPSTLAPLSNDDSSGVRITPDHVHLALRKHMGIAESEIASQFQIGTATEPVEELPLFT